MKKITIINGEFHEEEISDSPQKVTKPGVLIFGTGGGTTSNEEFRKMFYEPDRYHQQERESFERNSGIWGTTSPDNSGLAGAFINSPGAMSGLTNSFSNINLPITNLIQGVARNNDTVYEYLNFNRQNPEQRNFAILKARRTGFSSTHGELMTRMYESFVTGLDPYLSENDEISQP